MVLGIILDQAFKWWMLLVYDIENRGRVHVLPFMDLVYARNTGISYGLFANFGPAVLIGFSLILIVVMAIWLAQNSAKLVAIGLGLVMGGAFGNVIDRITLGGVAAFIQLHAFGFYCYIFNIADVLIFVGVACLLYDVMIVSRKTAAKPS
jgi:signal peptidase II